MRSLNSYKGIHKGETCAVLGGAVTLPADLREIPKVDILIGVNQHALILPLDYVCFLDRDMWNYVEGFRDILKVTPLNKFSGRDDVIHAGEAPVIGFSGALAVWVASIMGFEKIYVCGMDQYEDRGDGREYWWEGPQTKRAITHGNGRDSFTRWQEFINSLEYKERVEFVSGRLKEKVKCK
jgi:hypothetical protein